jgi:hypothetical protein
LKDFDFDLISKTFKDYGVSLDDLTQLQLPSLTTAMRPQGFQTGNSVLIILMNASAHEIPFPLLPFFRRTFPPS